MNEITSRVETITVERAKQYLTKNDKNRPVNETNLNFIINEMRKGKFLMTGESIKFDSDGRLIDGQHRLLAVVQTGIEQKMVVIRGLDPKSFTVIDTGRKRSSADVLGIQGYQNPLKLSSMVRFIMNISNGAISSAAAGDRRTLGLTNADISNYMTRHEKSILDSFPHGFNKENKLVTPSILAALHYLVKKEGEENASEFCWKVSSGENLSKDCPVYQLRQRMTADIRSSKKMGRIEKIALLFKAWNLYKAGKKITILRWDSLKEPFPKIG